VALSLPLDPKGFAGFAGFAGLMLLLAAVAGLMVTCILKYFSTTNWHF
jgi:hypothetical protein